MIVAVVLTGLLAVGVLEFLPGSQWRWLAVIVAMIQTACTLGLRQTERHPSRTDGPILGIGLLIGIALCLGTLGIAITS